jgi:hypothetical protein
MEAVNLTEVLAFEGRHRRHILNRVDVGRPVCPAPFDATGRAARRTVRTLINLRDYRLAWGD